MSNKEFYQWQETFSEFILNGVKTMFPAKIVSYDSSTRKASIQILTSYYESDEESNEIAILTEIPCSLSIGGGFYISFPYKAGDLGRLCIFSNDIDEYKSTGAFSPQDVNKTFDYHDSIFIPDFQPFSKSITGLSSDNLVIGLEGGNLTLELTPDKEFILKQNGINKLKLNTDGTFSLIGNVNITGSLTTTSTITCLNAIVNGKSVNGHTHSGVQNGTGNTAGF